jgi:hypothetical protein
MSALLLATYPVSVMAVSATVAPPMTNTPLLGNTEQQSAAVTTVRLRRIPLTHSVRVHDTPGGMGADHAPGTA